MISNFRTLKPELLAKFKYQCAYCGTKLYSHFMADIEHFYPKSLYPHLLEDSNNLLIACKECNIIKGNNFPLDDDGNPLLLNPLTDKFSENIKQTENGYLEGLTERGRVTIAALQLNRPSLIEQRILDVIKMEYADESTLSEREVYMTFKNSMQNVAKFNHYELSNDKDMRAQSKRPAAPPFILCSARAN